MAFKWMVFPLPESEDGLTLEELVNHYNENGVPAGAKLEYIGCGSHNMQWAWRESLSTEAEHAERLKQTEEEEEVEF